MCEANFTAPVAQRDNNLSQLFSLTVQQNEKFEIKFVDNNNALILPVHFQAAFEKTDSDPSQT